MTPEERWGTPSLDNWKGGTAAEAREFLVWRLEEWFIKPALFLFKSQPAVPGHIGALMLLCQTLDLVARVTGVPIEQMLIAYGRQEWGAAVDFRLEYLAGSESVAARFENDFLVPLLRDGRPDAADFKTQEAFFTLTSIESFYRDKITFDPTQLVEQLAEVPLAALRDMSIIRCSTAVRYLNREETFENEVSP